MLKSIRIKNFRGIKECEISDFALVNIFVGENNSGKSTILDAIYLACKEPLRGILSEVLSKRIFRGLGVSELFYAYDRESTITISIQLSTGKKYSLQFYINKSEVPLAKGVVTIPPGLLISQIEDFATTSYSSDLRRNAFHRYKFNENFHSYCDKMKVFLSSVRVDDLTKELDTTLASIKRNKDLEVELVNRMSEIYGEFGYEYIPRPENIFDRRVAFKEGSFRIYSEFHGSGIQRAVALISSLLVSKHTALLVEEIEVFQHPKALQKLAKHMVELARKNDVQLFLTTHSYYDALRYFYYAFEDENQRKEEFRSFLVNRKNGIVEAKIGDAMEIIKTLYS